MINNTNTWQIIFLITLLTIHPMLVIISANQSPVDAGEKEKIHWQLTPTI
jgi:hypothetical protein